MSFPHDFYPIAVKAGMFWNAGYRIPGRTGTVMLNGQPRVFYSKEKALLAGCMEAMWQMRDKTTGWHETPLQGPQKEIERVFGG